MGTFLAPLGKKNSQKPMSRALQGGSVHLQLKVSQGIKQCKITEKGGRTKGRRPEGRPFQWISLFYALANLKLLSLRLSRGVSRPPTGAPWALRAHQNVCSRVATCRRSFDVVSDLNHVANTTSDLVELTSDLEELSQQIQIETQIKIGHSKQEQDSRHIMVRKVHQLAAKSVGLNIVCVVRVVRICRHAGCRADGAKGSTQGAEEGRNGF